MPEIKKYTAKYEIADLKIKMTTYYDRVRQLAKEYLAKTDWDEPDYEIDFGVEHYENLKKKGTEFIDRDSVEYITTGSLFNRFLTD